ncbi:MAG: hypothetical protein JXR76_13005 [Deltaproteobacteria bacterium]|nr:hypothetical protein [Deltaproteobacteria bacterium]
MKPYPSYLFILAFLGLWLTGCSSDGSNNGESEETVSSVFQNSSDDVENSSDEKGSDINSAETRDTARENRTDTNETSGTDSRNDTGDAHTTSDDASADSDSEVTEVALGFSFSAQGSDGGGMSVRQQLWGSGCGYRCRFWKFMRQYPRFRHLRFGQPRLNCFSRLHSVRRV